MINLSDRQDIIGYLAWCEACGIEPFGEEKEEQVEDEDEMDDDEEENEEKNQLSIKRNERKGRMINYGKNNRN